MSIIQKMSRTILYQWMGWTNDVTEPLPPKAIICLAPHTSNWDFVLGMLYSRAEGFVSNFLMKKEWFFWPMGCFMRSIGGIPVFRSKKTSMTDQLAEAAKRTDNFHLCITPEGTRSRTEEWKHGFYYIALKAQLPIVLYALDFKEKRIVGKLTFYPTGDVDKDMNIIKRYYKDFKGKHPENFTIGKLNEE